MNINLSKFKKTKEDERSTELLHPDGHTIRIAHNGLKPAMRKELQKIPLHAAEGVKVPEPIEGADREPSGFDISEGLSGAWDAVKKGFTEPVPGQFGSYSPEVVAARGSALQSPEQSPEQPMPVTAPEPVAAQPKQEIATEQPAVNPLMAAEANSAKQMLSANQSGIAGEQAKALAIGNTGAKQAKQYGNANDALKLVNDRYNKTVDDLSSEGGQVWQEMNSPNSNIDPEHFWTNHSKVSAAIGMILGGLGSGLTGGENPAVKYIQNQMDMDLKSQELNLGKKKSLLDYNIKRFDNARDGLTASRVMQNDMLVNRINQIAASNASPLAKANAQIASVHYKQENAKLIHQIAVNQALMGLNKSGPDSVDSTLQYLRVNNPEKAKEIEGRYVPGVGVGSVPVPEDVRKKIIGMKDLDQKLRNLESFAQKHQGTVLDRGTINEGKVLAADATNAMRDAKGLGVYRPGEQEFSETIIDSDPTKFMANVRTTPKYRAFRKSNEETLHNTLKSFGLPTQSALPPEYKTVKGVKYMRGPKGEPIKVK